MKKFIAILLTLSVLICLCACGAKKAETEAEENPSTKPEAEEPAKAEETPESSDVLPVSGAEISFAFCNVAPPDHPQNVAYREIAEEISELSGGILIILIVSILKVGLSSNTVTASIIIPIIIALATTYNLPMMGIVIPACLTLSLAFILVTSTPTSILPYSYGYFTITDMAKPGTVLTLLSSGILTLVIYSIGLLSGIY